MANNLIQIKRSLNTAVPASLANGELAFTANGDHLYIGSPNGSIIPIGGFFNYGVLTANQALVANSTGYIDAVKTANLTVRSITANGVYSPGAGYLLSVDAGGNTFWLAQSSVSINTAAAFTWSGIHAFNANVSFGATLTVNGTLTANGSQLAVEKEADFNANVSFGTDEADVVSFVATIGSNFIPSTGSAYSLGNSSIRWSTLHSDTVSIGAGAVTANSTRLAIGTGVGLVANGTIGSANQVLRSNGTSIYWDTDAGDVSEVVAGSGLTGGGTSGSVTLNVGAANGISVDTDAVGVVTGSTLTVNSTGIHVNSALSIQDLTLAGNLTVSGTLTTIDTTNLVVEDPMIELANGNVSTDALDIGFFGQYGATGTKYTGLFRDASDGIYKLYSGLTVEPTTTVDTANASYTVAALQAYLNSGALVSNATNLALTANSTVNVAIVANNLSWSGLAQNGIIYGGASGAFTSLSAGAGGTVLMISTAGVPEFATLDGGSF